MTRGLVLGAGGVLGAAWTIGALAAVQETYGWDPREADVLIGTSAGSVMAAMLGSGISVDQLLNHQKGVVVPGDPQIGYDYDSDSGGALPPRPKIGIGSPRGVVSSALRPWKVTPMAALSAVLPQGRGSLEPVGAVVDAVNPTGGWAEHDRTWIVAMDYDNGRRTVFGREGAPLATVTKRLVGEIKKVAATGTKVTLLGPGPDDLDVIGSNMMDPRRREQVLETSLRTSRAALAADGMLEAG
ncbi:MAG: hypothetical protein LC779_12640 [Actinobacteria bacterium]|nr:hypothetical protein [Actinomycetota bacterium]